MVEKVKSFLQESRQEFDRVNWPSRSETVRLTGLVIGMSLGVSIFLGAFDFLFAYILAQIIA